MAAAAMRKPPGAAAARPWYREAWVWFVIGLPAAAVLASGVTLALAIGSSDGVVASDYYKRGLAINERLARTRAAARLGLQADVRIDGIGAGETVRLRLRAAGELPDEAVVRVRLVHPGKSGADRSAVLARVPGAFGESGRTFVGQWSEVAPMPDTIAWRVVVEGDQWRLDGDAGAAAWPREIRLAAVRD